MTKGETLPLNSIENSPTQKPLTKSRSFIKTTRKFKRIYKRAYPFKPLNTNASIKAWANAKNNAKKCVKRNDKDKSIKNISKISKIAIDHQLWAEC